VPAGPGVEAFLQQYATDGPMARNVPDLALLLAVQAGFDARAPLSLDGDPAHLAAPFGEDVAGRRVGWMADGDGYLPMEPGVLGVCEAALRHLHDLGCAVEPVVPAFPLAQLWEAWVALRSWVVAGQTRLLWEDPALRAQLNEQVLWEVETGRRQTAEGLWRASEVRTAWYFALLDLFQRFDVLVLPSAQVFPFDAGLRWPTSVGGVPMDTYHRWMEVVVGPTMAGLPALSVPAGFGPGGLPMGIQLVGPPRADRAVLELGHAYDLASGVSRVRSPLLSGG
jgi:amidase